MATSLISPVSKLHGNPARAGARAIVVGKIITIIITKTITKI
ncbi:hypothetical protein [Burkholderia thailandensis]|nr:hypothetical protein [Burkholderia thailandensis]MBS2131248.1 3-isopropylmalate dehydrogenase [Burkholderia thailandensis]MCS3396459.1 3-isopropylmalate dehydrogenase [Burkholderia thailandensis]MCS6469695.1 3-isopropylmalate dehydrogenase [Burkholderia thailandensis]MCS6476478.1 3-isopropylmalate dehydrogenase [Burkholderia thailandensis]MCS6495332.1 3-isopropylmalate dehydrogenase [Burkholderia thailandensis]